MSTWKGSLFVLAFILTARSHPLGADLERIPRDLTDLFDYNGDTFISESEDPTDTYSSPSVFGYTSSVIGASDETKTPKGTITSASGTLHSIVGTLPTYTTTHTSEVSSISKDSTITSTPTPSISIGVTPEAPSMPPAEATEWKVIGLLVVSIGLVATVILAVVFFDAWWGFLRDLVLGKRNKGGVEDLVPDWKKRSWEYKLSNEDGHRYPTIASLECISKELSDRNLSATGSPGSAYISQHDPHPLEPLVRRPSTNPFSLSGPQDSNSSR